MPRRKNKDTTNYAELENLKLQRHIKHSHFSAGISFSLSDSDEYFTCSAFYAQNTELLMGTVDGSLIKYNLLNEKETNTYQCHRSSLTRLEPSRDSRLLLTCSLLHPPLSALLRMQENKLQLQRYFFEENYIEFGKLRQDKIIATKAAEARIYDVETGTKLMKLRTPNTNNYCKNRATFSYTDKLAFCDGVLWDVCSMSRLHRFPKLNENFSGVFHPNGIEIISNNEVYDVRNFKELYTVVDLDNQEISFTQDKHIIYCKSDSFQTSFKTMDSINYSLIATIDVGCKIYNLSLNTTDTQIALVENNGIYDGIKDSTVRLYDIGRQNDSVASVMNMEDDVPLSSTTTNSQQQTENTIQEQIDTGVNAKCDTSVSQINKSQVFEESKEYLQKLNNFLKGGEQDLWSEEEELDEALKTYYLNKSVFNMETPPLSEILKDN